MAATMAEQAPKDEATAPAGRSPSSDGPWHRSQRALTLGLLLTVSGVAFEALAVAGLIRPTADDFGGRGV